MSDNTPNPDAEIEGVLGRIALFVLPFVAIIFGLAAKAWTLLCLWEWYITPTFGLAPLSFVASFGLTLIVGVATVRLPRKDEADDEKKTYALKMATHAYGPLKLSFAYAYALSIGWLVHVMWPLGVVP